MSVSTSTGGRTSCNTSSSPTLHLNPINHGNGGITIGTVGIAGTDITNSGCTSGGGTSTSNFNLDLKLDGLPGGSKKLQNLYILPMRYDHTKPALLAIL